MFDFHEERARRTAQFATWLQAAMRRAQGQESGDWFVVFGESPSEHSESRRVREKKKARAPRAAAAIGLAEQGGLGRGFAGGTSDFGLPDEGWRQDDSSARFVQFAFSKDFFYADLPLTTLSRAEAERILTERAGFRYMAKWREFPVYSERAANVFNPLDKLYMPGDEAAAAEDAAFIFFDLWKFPVDWKFYVTACAFNAKARLAKDGEME